MQKNLVSLLTPMYNTELYVYRLLDSILSQDYPYIEMIVIDDGSKDSSRIIVEAYKGKFELKGYSLYYVYQDNAGQSTAIKNGLQLINGEFLAWPDSDDFYATNDAISQMVNVLKSSSNVFQMVRTQETLLEDGTLKPIGFKGSTANETEPQSLFYDCLYGSNGFYYCSGAYMIRTEALYETTKFDIYTDKYAGQNWQILLPILYKYRCKTILKPLYNVIVRKSSHSRGQFRGYEAIEKKFSSYWRTQVETLKKISDMPKEELDFHCKNLSEKYNHQLFRIAIYEAKIDKAIIIHEKLKICKANTFVENIVLFLTHKLHLIKTAVFILKINNKLSKLLNVSFYK